jgi:hypothetical protein
MKKIIFVLVLLGVSGALMAEAEYDRSQKISQTEFVKEFNDLFSVYPYVTVKKSNGFELIDTGKVEYGLYKGIFDDYYLYIYGKQSTVEIKFTETASSSVFNAQSAEGRSRFKREFTQILSSEIQRNRWDLNVNNVLPAVLR